MTNLEDIKEQGYTYLKRDYYDNEIEIYISKKGLIFYDSKNDKIILQTDDRL